MSILWVAFMRLGGAAQAVLKTSLLWAVGHTFACCVIRGTPYCPDEWLICAVAALAWIGGKLKEHECQLTQAGRNDGLQPPRWPALDGLRAVAVLAVIIYHFGLLPGGYLGVDLFFVLSGFLITSLLIREWDRRRGHISFRDFYLRRVLRLFPALGCVIAVTVALIGLLELSRPPSNRQYVAGTLEGLPLVVTFVGNWARALDPASSLGMLGHTWSLAIEEQFYLLWPALFVLLMRHRFSRGFVALSLTLIAVAEMAYRMAVAFAGYGSNRIYYGTDTHSDGLLIGCAIAFWLASHQSTRVYQKTGGLLKGATGLATAVLATLFVLGNLSRAPIEIPLAVLACGAVLVGAVAERLPLFLERLLSCEGAVLIGRRSYGLYLWHYIVLGAASALYPAEVLGSRRIVTAVILGALFIMTFLVTELSYRFIELPALRLKRRFREE
jgi:peptidoglycan/LPS O-acetylase OafA/YrhL